MTDAPEGHDLWEALAVGSVLHALEPGDEALFADHVRTCERCRAVVAESADLSVALASTAETATPPARLRDRIVALTRDDGARLAPVVDLVGEEAAAAGDEMSLRRAARRTSRVSPVLKWVAAAVVVTAAATSAVTYSIAKRPTEAKRVALACLMDTKCQRLPLEQKNDSPIGAVLVQGDGTMYVMSSDLPKTPSNEQYVLWKGDATGHMTAVTGFTKGSSLAVKLGKAPDMTGVAALAISREAAGALPAQPSAPLGIATVPSA